ncbi:sigma-70 family RNA polymerase sigma factor [Iodidimonas sp. SYSU 1G8]|uniref:sigma-70 family RNA polymerase sigma factor n=1 Tax=Iodidimonas sp. SYSU 1G8 TaxID=3133967 RepID=UPI0031FF1AE1
MSKTTIALEALVADVIANTPRDGQSSTARQRFNVDRAFASILKLAAPRIRHFIRKYGLMAHWEDAEQAAAIGIHRAIQAYDPEKAQFTTFVNWQIRGELQALRFRLMTDQRPSAKKVEATTVSMQALGYRPDGEDMDFEATIEDEGALARVESEASAYLAHAAIDALLDQYVKDQRTSAVALLQRKIKGQKSAVGADGGKPRLKVNAIDPAEIAAVDDKLLRDRQIVRHRILDQVSEDELAARFSLTKERIRQITKHAVRAMANLVERHPRFALLAEYGRALQAAPATPVVAQPKPVAMDAQPAAVSLLPVPRVPQTDRIRVVAIQANGSVTSDFLAESFMAGHANDPHANGSHAAHG